MKLPWTKHLPGAAMARLRSVRYTTCVGCGTGLLLAIGFALLAFDWRGDSWFHHASYDIPFTLRMLVGATPPPEITIVYMDEQSHEALQQPFDRPWSRALHTRLLERLRREGARLVGFDVVFSRGSATTNAGPEDPASGPAALAKAMRDHGKVVIASHVTQGGPSGSAQVLRLERPDPVLAEAAAAVGLAEVVEDTGAVVRELSRRIDWGDDRPQKTLAWQAAALLGAPVTTNLPPASARWLLNYYGPPQTFRSVSFASALQDVPAGYFENAIVLVGDDHPVEASGMTADTFANPFGVGPKRFRGVEVHATALANLLRGDWLRRPAAWLEFMLVVVAGGLAGVVLPRLRPQRTLLLALAAVLVAGAGGILLQWTARLTLPWMIVVGEVALVAFWAVFFRALRTLVEREVLSRSLSLYLSPEQAKDIRQHPDLLRPGGVQQVISILSSDIANFSRVAERMPADDLVKLLNEYYEEAIGCVFETNGTVVNLIGDAIFAVWNAPQPQKDHRERACRAALLLRARSDQFNTRPGVPPLLTRVGLHCGTACVGNVGSTHRFTYTAIGEAVNLTFRLEGLNKHLATAVLATRSFMSGLEESFRSRSVGVFRFKGFDTVVEVFEVFDTPDLKQAAPPWVERFSRGLHHFQRCAFDEAEAVFREVLALRPGDGPSAFYLERITEFRREPPPRDWSGEIELREK